MANVLSVQEQKRQLAQSLSLAGDIITREYLSDLSKCNVCKLPSDIENLNIADFSRIYRFERIVSDKAENTLDKLVTVFNTAYSEGATVITLIRGHKVGTEYYMGIVCKNVKNNRANELGKNFIACLKGNFPGIQITGALKKPDAEKLINDVFDPDCIGSISGISSIRKEERRDLEAFVQGIEHMVDSLAGREYSVVIIADPVSQEQIALARSGYDQLYSQISPLARTVASVSETETETISSSHTDNVSETITNSTSLTQNYSVTDGWSETQTEGSGRSFSYGQMAGVMAGVALGAGIIATGGAAAIMGMLTGSRSTNISSAYTRNKSMQEGTSDTTSTSRAAGTGSSDTEGKSNAFSQGHSMQYTAENQVIISLMERIKKQIERLDLCESYGAFDYAAYVISSDPMTMSLAANSYNALMRGDNSYLQPAYINKWMPGKQKDEDLRALKKYLTKFTHPQFLHPLNESVKITPGTVINSYELAICAGLPRRSIMGLSVYEMERFGRNVNVNSISAVQENLDTIDLGSVYHLGNIETENKVQLDLPSLTMHTLITGSTGSGKSNTIYHILKQLRKQKIPFMVIEPAKGEYKDIFGGLSDVCVYGTNPYETKLLKINPFRFERGIHVLEHVDRLVEVFNACWPMYAAMPAVLKEAIIQAYEVCGWDLERSVNCFKPERYPGFADLLYELSDIINKSSYDDEVKSNYKGSLETRIKSLTNGLNHLIFSSVEDDSKKLFDESSIIDLSRIGSLETKSLIMGIMIMRLNEYRMTHHQDRNASLRHVTVLEEAHNILKRMPASAGSIEGGNVAAKSVEMLSNSIAEMRTYGEGFIIADQSPGALDISAIRNTNTKIIMRLPETEDRLSAGKSAAIRDEQMDEIARLPRGVACVYQNNWIEPVLVAIDEYKPDSENGKFQFSNIESNFRAKSDDDFKQEFIRLLMKGRCSERIDVNIDKIREGLDKSELPFRVRLKLKGFTDEYSSTGKLTLWEDDRFEQLALLVTEMISDKPTVYNIIMSSVDFLEMDKDLQQQIRRKMGDISNLLMLEIENCLLRSCTLDQPSIYMKWRELTLGKGVV